MSSGMWDGGDELFGALLSRDSRPHHRLPTLENYTLHCIARRFLIQQRFDDQCGVRGGAIARKKWVGFGRVQFLMLFYENRLLVDTQHYRPLGKESGSFIG